MNPAHRHDPDSLYEQTPPLKTLWRDSSIPLGSSIEWYQKRKAENLWIHPKIKTLTDTAYQGIHRIHAKTFHQWQEEIARMWRFTKSNGITEGFHRKMKLIQRRAYGFRNFENYRTRVRVLCK
jgi:transposase